MGGRVLRRGVVGSLWPCVQCCEWHPPENAGNAGHGRRSWRHPSREQLPATTTVNNVPLSATSSSLHRSLCRLSVCKITITLYPSSSQWIFWSGPFFNSPLMPSYLFSCRLIIPFWLVTFTHVHVACMHLNLSANRH